ncbi:MvdC/MvdD family ATP grasp protein [Acaryochloris sp. 'Moss Beach']|uniref:MvdC/MvdD family ATP grasp protein n=1 Tax=Acaryochloris sp. 'Moss Beach' TaxID=2740837 RepID=UPI0037BE7290
MIIIISNLKDVTSDFVCRELDKKNVEYFRINTDTLIEELEFSYTLSHPILKFKELVISPDKINSVWYRRPQEIKFPSYISYDLGEINHLRSEWKSCIEGFFVSYTNK